MISASFTYDGGRFSYRYHRSQDSQSGVLLTVMNGIAQHELRAAVSLYLLMWAHLGSANARGASAAKRTGGGDGGAAEAAGEPPHGSGDASGPVPSFLSEDGSVTVSEAEHLCSRFFGAMLGGAVHVSAEAALDQLLRHGLVRPTEAAEALPQSYVALPIHKAVASLREVWGSEKLRPNLEATCGASGARGGAPALALLLASAPNLRGRGDSTSEELSPVRRAPFRRGSETSTRRE